MTISWDVALSREEAWRAGKYEQAATMFNALSVSDDFVEFLTLPAYEYID